MWKDGTELFAQMRKHLFPVVVGDILDSMGHRHQFLSAAIKPVRADMVVVGRAMPVLEADCLEDGSMAPAHAKAARRPQALTQPFGPPVRGAG